MAKGTIIFFFLLTAVAALLLGINIGKKLGTSQPASPAGGPPAANYQPTTNPPSPTVTITPTLSASPSAALKKTSGMTTFSDRSCGFSFSYPGSFIKQKTVNAQSTIYTDPDNPDVSIAATCADRIPRPPVASDKIESITLSGTAATLYHDQAGNGTPRDEIIVKNPNNGLEIILAGYGETFRQALASFRFIQ